MAVTRPVYPGHAGCTGCALTGSEIPERVPCVLWQQRTDPGACGRRQADQQGQQTRQRIVAAAAELMFEGGVAGTTMEDVRRRGGEQLADLPLLHR